MKNFEKVVKIGTTNTYDRPAVIYCKIEFKEGKLSISGVEGPKNNGDCVGACGQIVMHLMDDFHNITPADGWDLEKIEQFLVIWDRWHLNDMRAGCEHQRAANWGEEKIEVVTYGQTTEAYQLRKTATEKAEEAARAGVVADLTDTEKALLAPDWFKDKFEPPAIGSPLAGMYEVKKRETKSASWVHPYEHPRGVLGKPCPVCGYKYGSAWLREEVPAEVLEFLAGLPESDTTPAWV